MDILKYNGIPEAHGISSSDITDFISDLARRELFMHSFILLQDGMVIAEGYWPHFNKDRNHRMYSVSKTFVATAIGALIDEGKISIDDSIMKFFPEYADADELLHLTTIRDLLIMATPHRSTTYSVNAKNWTETFFKTQPHHPSGTLFNYDTSGSYILDVIVQRVSGKPFLEYLKDRMLREIGFTDNTYVVKAPEGISWGGSGVLCTTRDLARLAQLYMDRGRFNGKQLLSEEFISAATSKQIDNCYNGWKTNTDGHGYGYQIWRTRDNSYSFLGMGGQLAISIPDKRLILCTNADVQGLPTNYEGIFEALWNFIVTRMSDSPLPECPADYNNLKETLADLKLPIPAGENFSSCEQEVFNRKYIVKDTGISEFSFKRDGNKGIFSYTNRTGSHSYEFGFGEYLNITFPETHYFGDTIGTPLGRGYDALAAAVWVEPRKLMLRTFLTDDYFGNWCGVFAFKGDRVTVGLSKTAEWFLDEYTGFGSGIAADTM